VPKIRILPKGGVIITLDPKGDAIPGAVKKARVGAASLLSQKDSRKKTGYPSAKALRPNPQIVNFSYNHIHEAMAPGSSSISAIPKAYAQWTRLWSGTRTPNFATLKPPRKLPINSATSRITEVKANKGVFLNRIPSTGVSSNYFTAYTEFYPAPPDPYSHIPGVEFKALRKLIEKAQVGIEANLAQDFAQLHQTVDLIGNTANRLRGALLALKSGNIPKAIKDIWQGKEPVLRLGGKLLHSEKSLANNWLELQYGWKPLLQDIHGAFESLAQLTVGDLYTRRVAASASMEDHGEGDPITHWLGSATKVGAHYYSARTRCKYVLRYKVDNHLMQFLQQTGFTNLPNLVWEILPLSFVSDWFVPLGPWLETLRSWDGLTFVDGSVTLFTRRGAQSVVNFNGAVAGAPGQLFEENATYYRETIQFERGRLTDFPSAYMPRGFKSGVSSTTHAANAVALLTGFFHPK